jgi:DHA1 family tetracycline resistance protein-like MFS transporter
MTGPDARGIRARGGRKASVGFVIVTLIVDALGFGLVIPIIPPLVLELSGLDVAGASLWVGGLLAMYALMQFFCAPVLGALSDRFGRRPVLLLSLAGICANYLLLAWAPSLGWLFAGRLIAGATAANVSTANAYIADITPPEQRAARFGLVGASFGIGFVAGPALGGLLGSYDLRLPFIAAAALAGANVLYGLLALPESLPPERRRRIEWASTNPLGSLHVIMSRPGLPRLALTWGCTWFALGALPSSFVLANTMRFGWDSRHNGIALGLAGLGSAIVQGLLVRRIVPALGEQRAAVTGALLVAAAYACQAAAPFAWVVFLSIALQAAGAYGNAAVQALVAATAEPDRQGETQGALSSLQGLVAIFSPLVASFMFSTFTRPDAIALFPGAPFVASCLAMLLGAWSVWGLRPVAAKVGPTGGTP